MVDKYTWVDLGSSYLPSDMLAAYLFAQLEAREKIQQKRKLIWDTYHTEIKNWAQKQGVRQPIIPGDCEQAYHMYYLLLPDLETRQRFIAFLKDNGILSVFHYLPLHLSDMGKKFGGKVGDCPVTEDVSDRLVRLPMFYNLPETDLSKVIETISSFKI